MFKRKLLALDHHNPEDNVLNDETSWKNLIVWLEDQKIRHYKIEDRECLRNMDDSNWPKELHKYIKELNCPDMPQDRAAVIDWLLGYAIRLEYGDNVEKYKDLTAAKFKAEGSKGGTSSTNPLDALDFDSPEFKKGILTLAQMLQVPPHPDHKEVLKAICKIITERLNKEAIEGAGKTDSKIEKITMESIPVGFDTGDYIQNDTAKVLRLLHIENLRELQTKINEAIVAVQAITANPKTDQRLGKVGR